MKPFYVLLVGAVILGATLGLVFIGGMAIINGQPEDLVADSASADTQSGTHTDEQFDSSQREDFRQRIQSGEITQEEADRLRQQFRQGGGQRGQGGGGFRGGGGQRGSN